MVWLLGSRDRYVGRVGTCSKQTLWVMLEHSALCVKSLQAVRVSFMGNQSYMTRSLFY